MADSPRLITVSASSVREGDVLLTSDGELYVDDFEYGMGWITFLCEGKEYTYNHRTRVRIWEKRP
ncbi:hypothetical protein SEA_CHARGERPOWER_99 [Mycobacterium phage Chargerpower]|nr:hypothetical protein SEA_CHARGERPOWER_99 [Mycobacterium phage Chargerpower]